MATALTSITAKNWQMALGDADNARLGEIVETIDDIKQSIQIILTTQLGSDRLRPDFGVDILAYLDKPAASHLPALIRAAAQAIQLWEPRIDNVGVVGRLDCARAILTVTWRIKGFNETQSQVVTVGGRT